ncbi:MAG TPA: hypothetical protein VGI28_15530 [Stellaceae bacterium]|jgi:hypothetical protein
MKTVRFASASDGGSQFIEVDLPIDNASTDAYGNTVHDTAGAEHADDRDA